MNKPPRILIVEDESLIALDLSRRLPKLGYEVCATVATGEDAVQKAAELKPNLVLMDICLRGAMDGIAAAEIIRQRSDVPVVYLTANSDEKDAAAREAFAAVQLPAEALQGTRAADRDRHGAAEPPPPDRAAGGPATRSSAGWPNAPPQLSHANEALLAEIGVRKHAEALAREQADLLAKARDAIYVRDLGGAISYWNRSAERLYGVPEAEALGRALRPSWGRSARRTPPRPSATPWSAASGPASCGIAPAPGRN